MLSFNTQNLADLSAICLHLSAWAATVRSQRHAIADDPQGSKAARLTSHELQIANLVAMEPTLPSAVNYGLKFSEASSEANVSQA